MVKGTTSTTMNGAIPLPSLIDIENLDGKDIYVTKRGIKLRIIPVPNDIVAQAQERMPQPKPPLRKDPADPEGNTYFEVHSDPKYQRELEVYTNTISKLNFQIAAAYGVQAYSVPEGMFGPEDEGWEQWLHDQEVFNVDGQDFSISVPSKDKPRARFTAWLRLYAISTDDIGPLYDAFLHGLGHIAEKDVEEAMDSFPGGAGRTPSN